MPNYHQFSGSLLYVEDEYLVRRANAELLTQCGYRVSEAGDAAEAIEILKANRGIDLVISDIKMPGEMDGRALARWVRDNRPSVPIILTSAYTRTREDEAIENVSYLGKPFTEQGLLDSVQRSLVRPPARPAVLR